jgi:hypothetical protein
MGGKTAHSTQIFGLFPFPRIEGRGQGIGVGSRNKKPTLERGGGPGPFRCRFFANGSPPSASPHRNTTDGGRICGFPPPQTCFSFGEGRGGVEKAANGKKPTLERGGGLGWGRDAEIFRNAPLSHLTTGDYLTLLYGVRSAPSLIIFYVSFTLTQRPDRFHQAVIDRKGLRKFVGPDEENSLQFCQKASFPLKKYHNG